MTYCPLKPAIGRVVVRPLTTEEKTQGNIYLPYGGEVSAHVMEVLAICKPYSISGVGMETVGPQYAVGDILVVGKFMGQNVEIGRDSYVIMREADVLGTYAPEPSISESNASDASHTIPSLPATGAGSPERDPGFSDPIASGDAAGSDRIRELGSSDGSGGE